MTSIPPVEERQVRITRIEFDSPEMCPHCKIYKDFTTHKISNMFCMHPYTNGNYPGDDGWINCPKCDWENCPLADQHDAGELPEGVVSAIREYLDGPEDCSEYEAGKRNGLLFVLDLPGILNRQQPRQEGL